MVLFVSKLGNKMNPIPANIARHNAPPIGAKKKYGGKACVSKNQRVNILNNKCLRIIDYEPSKLNIFVDSYPLLDLFYPCIALYFINGIVTYI